MKQLIYTSIESHHITFDEIEEIIKIAITENYKHNITGMLIYNGIYFLQVIEGDEVSVLQLFENLKKDLRHKDINILDLRTIEQRDFENWNMGAITDLKSITEVIFKVNGSYTFIPLHYNYEEALEILKKLTHLL